MRNTEHRIYFGNVARNVFFEGAPASSRLLHQFIDQFIEGSAMQRRSLIHAISASS